TGYGETQVLHGVSLQVGAGEVVALMGRNGAGKTTTLRSIIGLSPAWSGRISLNGQDITHTKPHVLAVAGIGYLPEHRGVFPSLTVHENLTLVAGRRPGPWTVERAYDLFPRLGERRKNGGAQLSGGEQQMLAIARALLLNPLVLLLDEPTEGLAPLIVREIGERLREIRAEGTTMLLVEQNARFALGLADRAYILSRGEVKWQGTSANLRADKDVQASLLGV
ncbi:MAG: ABC transporter ATP-binding protein, partial [Alphaproteobacteria bacterium]